VIEYTIVVLLAILAGIHLGWIDKAGKTSHFFRFFKKGIGVIIILAGLFYFYTGVDFHEGIKWTPYDEIVLERAAQESKPAIMDVYADWCIPCRSMDENLFRDSEVLKLSEDFIMVRLDITKKFPGQNEIRRKYSIEGAPTIIFFSRNGEEIHELRIESKIDADEFILKMQRVLEGI
jgi:thiol:disulfide interchange protein DsbD